MEDETKKSWIRVCSNCGSADLRPLGGGAEAAFDYFGADTLSGIMHCENCGKNVLPIEFENEKQAKKFSDSIKEKGSESETDSGIGLGQPNNKYGGVEVAEGFSKTYLAYLIFGACILVVIELIEKLYVGAAVTVFVISLLAWLFRNTGK